MLSICDAINNNIAKVILLAMVCKELRIKESQREDSVSVFQSHGQWEGLLRAADIRVLGKASSLVKCLH